jgi:selenocysteine-specific elongation factor
VSHLVLGTAGHIDHGKSSLVKALTGVDPDRLQEEQDRGITIELGFADLELGEECHLSLVDVPGHERFVRHMVAGATGIDAVMLVVAVDEGIMPQTREHLNICNLLEVRHGLVALTKTDLVDPELLEVVEMEVREFLTGSCLEDAELVQVSSRTGDGLEQIRDELRRLFETVSPREDTGLTRLPVDRCFSMKGFGTVVTGTLVAGSLSEGQEVEILPGGKRSRIRGLQVHGKAVRTAAAGRRTAVNLQGLRTEDVPRGATLAKPGLLQTTDRVWAHLNLLETAPDSFRKGGEVRFHQGTAEHEGRVRVLDTRDDGGMNVEIVLGGPTVLLPGDRFILRRPMPVDTLGGGVILDNDPPRGKAAREERLALAGAAGRIEDPLLLRLGRQGLAGCETGSLSRALGLSRDELRARLDEGESAGTLARAGGRYFLTSLLARLEQDITASLAEFHKSNPLKRGMPREALRGLLCRAMPQEAWRERLSAMVEAETIGVVADLVALPGHRVELSSQQKKRIERMEQRFRDGGLAPPSVEEVLGSSPPGEEQELFELLVERGSLVRLGDGRPFHAAALEELGNRLRDYAKRSRTIDMAAFKELAAVTRKNAIPLLEYLDGERQTRRVGDVREIITR